MQKLSLPQAISVILVILSFMTTLYVYPQLPDKIASHWGIDGKVNGYMDKPIGAFMLPALALLTLALLYALPLLDPLRKNYAAFKGEYEGMIAMLIGFFYYVHLLTIAYSLGYPVEMGRFLSPAFGALFYYLGIVLSKAKQNWFVGIRTPWTLSSPAVWDKTHKLCSKLFKAAGIIALLGAFFEPMLLASVAVLFAAAVLSVVYSYVEFSKEKKTL